jgi:tRNA (cmo5U34)-methyltransferase
MAQFHWDPDSYLELMRAQVPDYERLQDETANATGQGAARILELGSGTGETARRVLERHPAASLTGLDASPEMLARASAILPRDRVDLLVGKLEDPLPAGRFELVVSALVVHHLDGDGKARLFKRVASVLVPGGRFVLGDVVVPEDPSDALTPVDGEYDVPSTLADQLTWLKDAGFTARVAWTARDLVVIVGVTPASVGGIPRGKLGHT